MAGYESEESVGEYGWEAKWEPCKRSQAQEENRDKLVPCWRRAHSEEEQVFSWCTALLTESILTTLEKMTVVLVLCTARTGRARSLRHD